MRFHSHRELLLRHNMGQKHTPILGGAYEVVGIVPGRIGYKGGEVDLSKIDEAKAAKLVKAGCPYLVKAAAKPAEKKEPAKAEKDK